MAQEFNPNITSFHPIMAVGKSPTIPAGTFVNGWSATDRMWCTSCHENPAAGAVGAHGSPYIHIQNGSAEYQTTMAPGNTSIPPDSGEICFNCHSYAVYVNGAGGSSFPFHAYHNKPEGSFGTGSCYLCHDSHGSEQLHLINFDTRFITPFAGYDSQSAWVPSGAGSGTCYINCHADGGDNVDHGTGKSYP